jgi:2-polyprenyl-6-methoxyphenol hydroxylase-like FAD-dependent oxidoreductase
MDNSYDAIVVGARCAGSSTAMLLARRGLRVLTVDRATFPSDTMPQSGNVIPHGLWHLRRWGLLDRVSRTGAPPVDRIVAHTPGGPVAQPIEDFDGIGHCLVLRHSILDTVLAEAAAEAGATLELGARVTALRRRGDRVVGIDAVNRNGEMFTATAPIVVGADGRHSFVARTVGARRYRERVAGSFGFFTYYRDLESDGIEVWQSPTRQLIFFPTHGGETWVAMPRPAREMVRFKADPEGEAVAHVADFPDAADRLARATRTDRLHSTGDLGGFYRESAGVGWALVGDAGFTKDPTPGRGISDAFAHAELLAEAIASGIDRDDLDAALRHYAWERDSTTFEVYDATQDVAEWGACASMEEVGARFGALGAAEARYGEQLLARAGRQPIGA